MNEVSVSFGVAFLAGLVSFLSPCVLPIVPSYVTFITGMTLDELSVRGTAAARAKAALHASLFVLGFTLVFVTLGATATMLGGALQRSRPLLQQIGGIIITAFGLYLVGLLRIPALMRDRRVHLASKPAGLAGSLLVGVAFGAGWTPCVGPVLASILLYAGTRTTMAKGMLLLGTYTFGLGIPFFVAAVSLNWYLAGTPRMLRWLRPVEIVAGLLLIAVGVLLFTGRFTALSAFLADFGQLINVGS
ncbi:MAG TPA: cytochrome c biogenesis protein CcdA [Terriglobales bacterium]